MLTKITGTPLLTGTLACLYGLYNIYHVYYWRRIGGIEIYCFPSGQLQSDITLSKPHTNTAATSLPPEAQQIVEALTQNTTVSDGTYRGNAEQLRHDPGISNKLHILYAMLDVTIPQRCLRLTQDQALYISPHAPAGTEAHIWSPSTYKTPFFAGWKGIALYACNAAPIALTALYASNRTAIQVRHITYVTAAVFAINNIAERLRPTIPVPLYS